MNDRLTVSELWHGTIAVVQRHFSSFAVIAAVTVLLPSLLGRLLFTELFEMAAMGKPMKALPSGYWLYMLVYILATLVGMFSISAVAADADEGGGQTMGAIVRGVLLAIGKAFLAGLLFMAVYGAAIIVVAVVIGIVVGGAALVTSGGMAAGNTGSKTFAIVMIVLLTAVIFPLVIWASARLAPLTGVYLREPVGVVAGVKRAWALSKGSAWTIFKLVLVVAVLGFAPSAFQLGLVRMGFIGGVGGFLAAAAMGAVGALLFVYQAAGLGILYRRLAELDARALAG